jgi:hypothetical protein
MNIDAKMIEILEGRYARMDHAFMMMEVTDGTPERKEWKYKWQLAWEQIEEIEALLK